MVEINKSVDSLRNNNTSSVSNLEVGEKVGNIQNSGDVFANQNNELQCLPGFRFNPFDNELIVHYLRKKVNNQVLPHNKIQEIELYKYNPDDITKTDQGLGEKEWYFFTPRDRKYKNGKRPNRAAGDGYWKATGADKNIYHMGVVPGHRKTLVFYQGKTPKGEKTSWIMHEFRVKEDNRGPRIRTSEHDMRLDDWVLCRIYKKDDKRRKFVKRNQADDSNVNFQPEETEVPSPSNISNSPTPNNSNICTNTDHLSVSTNFCREISSFQRMMITGNGHYHSANISSFPNDHSFINPFAVNNPQPLSYVPSSFLYDQNNNNMEHDDWSCVTEDMLLDNPSLYNLDNIFSNSSQTNNSQIMIPSNMSNSSSSFGTSQVQPTISR